MTPPGASTGKIFPSSSPVGCARGAHHELLRRTVDVGIEETHRETALGKSMREIRRHGGLADAPLTGGHRHDPFDPRDLVGPGLRLGRRLGCGRGHGHHGLDLELQVGYLIHGLERRLHPGAQLLDVGWLSNLDREFEPNGRTVDDEIADRPGLDEAVGTAGRLDLVQGFQDALVGQGHDNSF